MKNPDENKYKNSRVIKDYFKNKDRGGKYGKIARAVYAENSTVERVIEDGFLPKYTVLAELVEYFDGSPDDIQKMAKQDPLIRFKYWNELYPEEDKIENIRFIIRDLKTKKGLTNADFSKNTPIDPTYISFVLNGKMRITYRTLLIFADGLGETTESLMDMMLGRGEIIRARQKFSDTLIQARLKMEYTVAEAAERCNIPVNKYVDIENGKVPVSPPNLERISRELCIKNQVITNLALESQLLPSSKSNEDWIEKFNKKYITTDLEEKILEYAAYDKIAVKKARYDAKSVMTLILLAIDNHPEKGEYFKGEILHYLRYISKKDNKSICEGLIFNPEIKGNAKTFDEAFLKNKEDLEISYSEIADISGWTKTNINYAVKNQSISLAFARDIFPAVYLTYSYGLYFYFEKKIKKEKKCDITENPFLKDVEKYRSFKYKDRIIPSDLIKSLIKIIYNSEPVMEKYRKMCNAVRECEDLA